MAQFKRWTHGVVASINEWIVQIENHEAQVASALRDLERGVARAKVHLGRVERDGQTLRQGHTEESEAALRWRERARREADEPRALECLRRSKRAEARSQELARQLAEHERLEQRLTHDVRGLEQRLLQLRQQRNVMRSRESRAEAFGALQGREDGVAAELCEALERWEERVTEAEVMSGCTLVEIDGLEEEFMNAEQETALKLELRELREEA